MTARRVTLAEVERVTILLRLKDCDGNRTRTAESLAISIRCLRNKLAQYREQGHAVHEYHRPVAQG